jgi:hypothetical protein
MLTGTAPIAAAVHPDDFFPPVSLKRSDLVCSWLLFLACGFGCAGRLSRASYRSG